MTEPQTLRILHAIDTGGSGGAETVFASIAGSLDSTRFTAIAVARHGGWLEEHLQQLAVIAKCVDTKGSFKLSYLRFLVRTISENNIDLIHSHLLGSNVYCALAARLTATPLVSVFHGLQDLDDPGMIRRIKIAAVNRYSDSIVAVSRSLKNELLSNGFSQPRKIHVVHNGIDTAQFRPFDDGSFRNQLGIADDTILVGAVGNIRRPKAYDVLIDAASQLIRSFPKMKIVIAGDNDSRLTIELREQIDRLGMDDHVVFLGYVPDSARLYNNLDVYVSSSTSEGFSMTCAEAMACGAPVIATRCGGPEEIIDHGVTGLLVETNDPEALAQGIRQILSDSDATQSRADAARVAVKRRFSVKSMLTAYEALYAHTLRRNRAQDQYSK